VRVDRPLDPGERFFWLANRVSCMNFVVFAELEGGVDASRLRAALDRAQRIHPLLRVRIAGDGAAVRFEPADGRRIRLAEIAATASDWGMRVERELGTAFGRGEAHLFYALQNLDEAPPGDEGVAWFGKRLRSTLPNVSLSNIGRVETIEPHGRVRAVSFALCPMPFQLAFCAVSTYAGRLALNLTYDAAKLPPRDAAQMTADLRDRLAAEASP